MSSACNIRVYEVMDEPKLYDFTVQPGDPITLQRPSPDHVWGEPIGDVMVIGIENNTAFIEWPPDFGLPNDLPFLVSLWHNRAYIGMAELHPNGLRRV